MTEPATTCPACGGEVWRPLSGDPRRRCSCDRTGAVALALDEIEPTDDEIEAAPALRRFYYGAVD